MPRNGPISTETAPNEPKRSKTVRFRTRSQSRQGVLALNQSDIAASAKPRKRADDGSEICPAPTPAPGPVTRRVPNPTRHASYRGFWPHPIVIWFLFGICLDDRVLFGHGPREREDASPRGSRHACIHSALPAAQTSAPTARPVPGSRTTSNRAMRPALPPEPRRADPAAPSPVSSRTRPRVIATEREPRRADPAAPSPVSPHTRPRVIATEREPRRADPAAPSPVSSRTRPRVIATQREPRRADPAAPSPVSSRTRPRVIATER
jgi:hypothetical protein